MKSIQEYIELIHDNNPKFLDKSYLEKYDYEDMMIINDCINKCYNNRYHIFESHSVFNKCRELSYFISLVLNNFIDKTKNTSILFLCNEIDELNNEYFNSINVNFEHDLDNNGEYEATNDNNKLNDNKFDYITININSSLNSKEIYNKLEHELTHAYDDLNRYISKSENIYNQIIRTKYNKLNIDDTDSKFVKDVKNLLYLLDRPEQNGYLAQFDGILGNKKFNNIQKAYNKIYNSKLYKDIKSFSYLIDNNDEEINNNICKLYKELFDSKDSNSKIIKNIQKEWKRFKEHFIRNIYQCVCDHIEIHEFKSSREFNKVQNKKEKELIEKIKNQYINKTIFIEY